MPTDRRLMVSSKRLAADLCVQLHRFSTQGRVVAGYISTQARFMRWALRLN